MTDNESAKMATSQGVIQGYNANAMVDEKRQIVTHAEVFGTGSDSTNMKPMLTGAKDRLEAIGQDTALEGTQISADTSYFSVENLEACEEMNVDAYVPDPHFRKRDPRFKDARRHRRSVDKRKERYRSKKRWFGAEDFMLDDRTGKLICPAGHGLYVKNRNFKTSDGYKAIAYQAPKTACRNCELRMKCLRNPHTESKSNGCCTAWYITSKRYRNMGKAMQRRESNGHRGLRLRMKWLPQWTEVAAIIQASAG